MPNIRLPLLLTALMLAACSNGTEDLRANADDGWVGSWAAAPYGPYPAGPLAGTVPAPLDGLTTPGAFADDQARDQSFRMIVNPTLGGETLRVRLSNLQGDRPVTFEPVRIARRAVHFPLGAGLGLAAAIVPGTDTAVSFAGEPRVVIPPGAEAVSDAVSLSFAAGDDLVVSFQVVGESGPMTWHAVSFDTQFVSAPGSGDRTGDVSGLGLPFTTVGWFFVSGIDVLRPDALGSIVMIGDSITDGAYQVPATDTRYPDVFARRLQAAGIPMGVLNQGINSNRITGDGSSSGGPSAVQRFDRDVLARAGVRSVLIFIGTNDLSAGREATEIYGLLQALTRRAQSAGLCVVLGTIPPRDDVLVPGWDRAAGEPQRQALNALIRADAEADGVADFDAVLRLPVITDRPNPLLYFPDLLHPNSLGFIAMADAIPLEALVPAPAGNCSR
jgi:lysophospholipase L1-like esterase